MEKTRRRRLSAKAWHGVLARFEESGLTAVAFCEREGVSSRVSTAGDRGRVARRISPRPAIKRA
jgi:hypothetical protein